MYKDLDIPEAIRVLRKEQKLSQGDLFNLTGIKESYISKLENGHIKPKTRTIIKLAKAFEISVSEFLKYAENHHGVKKD